MDTELTPEAIARLAPNEQQAFFRQKFRKDIAGELKNYGYYAQFAIGHNIYRSYAISSENNAWQALDVIIPLIEKGGLSFAQEEQAKKLVSNLVEQHQILEGHPYILEPSLAASDPNVVVDESHTPIIYPEPLPAASNYGMGNLMVAAGVNEYSPRAFPELAQCNIADAPSQLNGATESDTAELQTPVTSISTSAQAPVTAVPMLPTVAATEVVDPIGKGANPVNTGAQKPLVDILEGQIDKPGLRSLVEYIRGNLRFILQYIDDSGDPKLIPWLSRLASDGYQPAYKLLAQYTINHQAALMEFHEQSPENSVVAGILEQAQSKSDGKHIDTVEQNFRTIVERRPKSAQSQVGG